MTSTEQRRLSPPSRRVARLLVIALSLLACAGAFAAERPPAIDPATRVTIDAPDAWVVIEPLPAVQRTEGGDDNALQYLLLSRQSRVSDAGNARYTRIATAVTGTAGLQDASKLEFDFDPSWARLRVHHVTLHRDGRTEDRLDPSRVQLLQREEDLDEAMYNGRVSWVLVLSDVRVGDVIDMAYTIEGDNPVFGNRFFDSYPLRWSVPTALQTYRVRTPRARPLQARVLGMTLAPTVREEGDEIVHEWVQRQSLAVDGEEDAPAWHVQFPFVQVSEYRDWAEVVAWARALYQQEARRPQGALAAQLARWRAAGADGLRQATDHVQEHVRYFGYEFGANSHRPSDPNEVWADGFGDCKDKSLLLSIAFGALGVDAVPALVSTTSMRGVADMLPSPGAFDHVIVRWNDRGTVRWVDPTASFQRGPVAQRYVPDYGVALPITAGVTALEVMAVDAAGGWAVEVDETLSLGDAPGKAQLEVASRFAGAWGDAMRANIGARPAEERQREFANYYARVYREAEVARATTVRDDEATNVVAMSEAYRLPRIDETAIPTAPETIDGLVALPEDVQRHTPIALAHPLRATHRLRIVHPPAVNVVLEDAPFTIENPWLAYSRTVAREAGAVTVVHAYRSKTDAVPVAAVPEYLEAVRRIRDVMFVDAVAARASSHEERLARIRNLLQRGTAPAGASPAGPAQPQANPAQ
jgi:hypothetical protein